VPLLRRLGRQAPLVIAAALCAASIQAPTATIQVGGRMVRAEGVLTVEDALRRARVVVPAGHVLSVVSHRPIAGDHQPGQVLLDGHPAGIDTLVPPGAVLTFLPGVDVTEPVQVTREPVPPVPGVASLYVGGVPGSARVVRGTLSGEVASRRILAPPRKGHLIAPHAIGLTFDDGPDPAWTPAVLRLLARAHVHATFCVVGRHVAKYPQLTRAIVAGGHTLCNHTWSHDEHLVQRPADVIRRELAMTQAAVQDATGVTPWLFRAPGGIWSARVIREARLQGMRPLMWQVDPRDWTRPGWTAIVVKVVATLRPGAIVLLHDGGGNRAQTVAALYWMLIQLPRRHYTFATPQPF